MAIGDILAAAPGPTVDPRMGMQAPTTGAQPAGNVEQNKGLWRNILQQFSDPNFRAALGATGRGFMQSPQVGQSGWDVASQALGTGVDTLRALREHERLQKLQEQDRKIKEEQRGIENKQKDKTIGISEQSASTYGTATRQQGEASLRADENADATLTETTRSNKAQEEIARIRAEADRTRASFYSSGGKDPADITKINNLAAEYVRDYGMDEIAAKARATRDIELNSKTGDAGALARELYKTEVNAYMNSVEGFRKPLTSQDHERILNDSINRAMKVKKVSDASKGLVTAPEPTYPGQATGTIQRPGTNNGNPTVANPQTQSKIDIAKSKGIPAEKIREAIIAQGEDPALYGY